MKIAEALRRAICSIGIDIPPPPGDAVVPMWLRAVGLCLGALFLRAQRRCEPRADTCK